MKEIIITTENEGQRFDKYLGRILSDGGMSFIYKMLRKKNFVLNDKKADGKEILKCGDNIKLYISDETFEKFKSKKSDSLFIDSSRTNSNITNENSTNKNSNEHDIQSLIVYEDKDIILINKPCGILSQKADKNDISLNELVLNHLIKVGNVNKESIIEYKPSVINRLDRNTTGIIIVTKTLKAARILSDDLKNRNVKKYYQCIVYGDFDKDGLHTGYLTKNKKTNHVTITDNMVSDSSEYIETEYTKIKSINKNEHILSCLKVHLITGKSHQIRAHLANMQFPIIGDPKYGNNKINNEFKIKTQLLHAYKIEFPQYDDRYDFSFSGKEFICEPDFKI